MVITDNTPFQKKVGIYSGIHIHLPRRLLLLLLLLLLFLLLLGHVSERILLVTCPKYIPTYPTGGPTRFAGESWLNFNNKPKSPQYCLPPNTLFYFGGKGGKGGGEGSVKIVSLLSGERSRSR